VSGRTIAIVATIGRIRVARVSFMIVAWVAASRPYANPAATTEDVSLIAVPAHVPNPPWVKCMR
jgi:hypothetical protein